MLYQIEVALKPQLTDPVGNGVLHDVRDFGIKTISDVRFASVYVLDAELSPHEVESIAQQILADQTVHQFSCQKPMELFKNSLHAVVTVFLKPGVMDPVEASALKAITDLGYRINSVHTGRKYYLKGSIKEPNLKRLAGRIFANPVIENFFIGHKTLTSIPSAPPYSFKLETITLTDAPDEALMKISKERCLSLNLNEMKTVSDYFKSQKRNPTDIELETIAQTWSEHCKHKTLKGLIKYSETQPDGTVKTQVIDNLLKQTVMKATNELDKPWCISVFKDNAGIIEFDKANALCFKVETHNHPSAIEPYGGAGTGIGGVIRDVMGCGLGAKPILNTDVFCFAPPDFPADKVPRGVLHPKRIFKGVVAGVRDYGNRMGIPTANGALFFDDRYLANPLVYCGTAGIMPRTRCFKHVNEGDLILVAGGRTGRDGIHGVTFASIELDEKSEMISSGAVQIGNAIEEKKMLDVILKARDLEYYTAITDCGGGGLSSAVGEMAEETGAVVELEKIPLKYQGLSYTEIWISEAQERMVMSVPPKHEKAILELFAKENVEATIIGRFTGDKRLTLKYQGNTVANLEMEFLHNGLPKVELQAEWTVKPTKAGAVKKKVKLGQALKQILGMPNVCSKEWVIRQYDHEVQGASALKSMQGVNNDGPGDGCVTRPMPDSPSSCEQGLGSYRGFVIANGMSPKFGDLDPYAMAASAIDEALRNIVASGGDPERTAILDNFCWGNINNPEQLGAIVRASQACYDIAKVYETPFISGKDSLNNEYRVSAKKTISIPYSLLISAISVIEDVRKVVSMDLKGAGNLIYSVGLTKDELGGSHYYDLLGVKGGRVPQVDTTAGRQIMLAVSQAIKTGLVRACHDLSEGGLAVAAAEMAFAGEVGMEINLKTMPYEIQDTGYRMQDEVILFSESNSRFLVEVKPEHKAEFESVLAGCAYGLIGQTVKPKKLVINGISGKAVINEDLADLKESWQKPFRW
ncbi:MAG: phosphoribosylformylglycinamidine synthase subunit PurL [Planctomycetes bacterium]|nr:phosphoribosylformylglycinamidine synthase subunit PurL [Planctomycetota bacterium]